MPPSFVSCFDRLFDVAVVGSGWAGFAAAVTLARGGADVLLVGPRGDRVWESGRAHCPDVGAASGVLAEVVDEVRRRGGCQRGLLEGGLAEVVATRVLREAGVRPLYYAYPVAVERDGEQVRSLIVATKTGPRRVAARRWVDATEDGQLLRLMGERVEPRAAERRAWVGLQHEDWSSVGAPARDLLDTGWATERLASWALHADEMLHASIGRALGELPEPVRQAAVSHVSIEPLPVYAGAGAGRDAGNVACAAAALGSAPMASLGERASLGAAAAARVLQLPGCDDGAAALGEPIGELRPVEVVEADVVVAGLGTGGALAALAAGRAARERGLRVVGLEPMAFAGGIGSGGGIHTYYYGVPGGLQREVDGRVKALMQRFGRLLSPGPFNPEAKKLALSALLAEAGVDVRFGALLFGVKRDGDRVTAALVATAAGVVEVRAKAWIDGTGDGDLCALAGADFTLGREGDGLPHAYSQSSGELQERDGRIGVRIVNFDAGWCDPTDAEDLTRGRVDAIVQYLRDRYENTARPVYLAPAIGLRQPRQVVADHVLSLDDLLAGRRFDDAVGYSGCHYDNHAVDYGLESDDGLLWIWGARNWRVPMACEISYRMLLPRGLANVWVASRALGVSQDAHHSMRMQRDMQRVGEVAGLAAVAAAAGGDGASWGVDLGPLQQRLRDSGALQWSDPGEEDRAFGWGIAQPGWMRSRVATLTVAEALAALDNYAAERDAAGLALWWLARHPEQARPAVLKRLESSDPIASWPAACLLAYWGDRSAEPRLVRAIQTREYGYDHLPVPAGATPGQGEHPRPEFNNRLAPNWLVAAALLRMCGTDACLPALHELASNVALSVDARTVVAL